MADPNNAQLRRQGVIKRTIGGSLARSWPPPLPRRRCCCVLLLLLLALSAAAANIILRGTVVVLLLLLLCAVCGNFRLLCVCTPHASCTRVRQRAATKARSHQTDDRRLAPCRKRADSFRPRISPWVRAPGCTRGESGRLAPRRRKLGRKRAKASG